MNYLLWHHWYSSLLIPVHPSMHSINGGTLKSSILISCLNHAPSIFGVSKHPYLVAPIMNSVRDGDPWWYHHYILSSDGLKTTSQSAESNVARGKSIRKSHLKSIIDSGFSMIFPFLGGFPHEKPPIYRAFSIWPLFHCRVSTSPGVARSPPASGRQRPTTYGETMLGAPSSFLVGRPMSTPKWGMISRCCFHNFLEMPHNYHISYPMITHHGDHMRSP